MKSPTWDWTGEENQNTILALASTKNTKKLYHRDHQWLLVWRSKAAGQKTSQREKMRRKLRMRGNKKRRESLHRGSYESKNFVCGWGHFGWIFYLLVCSVSYYRRQHDNICSNIHAVVIMASEEFQISERGVIFIETWIRKRMCKDLLLGD